MRKFLFSLLAVIISAVGCEVDVGGYGTGGSIRPFSKEEEDIELYDYHGADGTSAEPGRHLDTQSARNASLAAGTVP